MLIHFNGYCQSTAEIALYTWYDNLIGKENLAINNGSIHTNPYSTIAPNSMYYLADQYFKGSVSYESQTYFDVDLKYDLFKDQLVLKPSIESNYVGVNLVPQKIDFFYISDKKFVNLSTIKSSVPSFIKGYYQEMRLKEGAFFYIKYYKEMREVINDNHLFKVFDERNTFILNYENVYYPVENKKDLIKILPNYKSEISEYYSKNKNLEKSDKVKFMENLMRLLF